MVRLGRLLAVLSLAGAVWTAPAAGEPLVIDPEPTCGSGANPLPAAVEPAPEGELYVRGLFLIDGIEDARAREIVAGAQAVYARLGVRLDAHFQRLDVPNDVTPAEQLLTRMNDLFDDGRVPAWLNFVHLVTDNDLSVAGDPGYNGLAECLGAAVIDPARAFSVGEGWLGDAPYRDVAGLPVSPFFDSAVAAHEIGHLLGGNHQHADCSDQLTDQHGQGYGCSVMFPDSRLFTADFGAVDGAIVRGYLAAFAKPLADVPAAAPAPPAVAPAPRLTRAERRRCARKPTRRARRACRRKQRRD